MPIPLFSPISPRNTKIHRNEDPMNLPHDRCSSQPRLELQGEHIGIFYLNADTDNRVLSSQGTDVGAGFPAYGIIEVIACEGLAGGESIAGYGDSVRAKQANTDLAIVVGFKI